MAKKMIFLLILLLGLLIASVPAFATTDTDTTTPNTGSAEALSGGTVSGNNSYSVPTNQQTTVTLPSSVPSQTTTNQAVNKPEEKANEYEQHIGKFLDAEVEPTESIYVNIRWNQKSLSDDPLCYIITGTIKPDTDNNSPLIVMLYIKADGEYVPLLCWNGTNTEKSNIIEEVLPAFTYHTNLLYLGLDKVNEVRIIAFRKNNAENLVLAENLQITDMGISVTKKDVDAVPMDYNHNLELIQVP